MTIEVAELKSEEHKYYVLEDMYAYSILTKKHLPLGEEISCVCFADWEGLKDDEIAKEEYAAKYFMWFHLRKLHGFNIDSSSLAELDKTINYLESMEEDRIIRADITELKRIKKALENN